MIFWVTFLLQIFSKRCFHFQDLHKIVRLLFAGFEQDTFRALCVCMVKMKSASRRLSGTSVEKSFHRLSALLLISRQAGRDLTASSTWASDSGWVMLCNTVYRQTL